MVIKTMLRKLFKHYGIAGAQRASFHGCHEAPVPASVKSYISGSRKKAEKKSNESKRQIESCRIICLFPCRDHKLRCLPSWFRDVTYANIHLNDMEHLAALPWLQFRMLIVSPLSH